jgi:hypothetical protein
VHQGICIGSTDNARVIEYIKKRSLKILIKLKLKILDKLGCTFGIVGKHSASRILWR